MKRCWIQEDTARETPDGEWVRHDDAEKLERENAALKAELKICKEFSGARDVALRANEEEISILKSEIATGRKSTDYWKAELNAANEEIAALRSHFEKGVLEEYKSIIEEVGDRMNALERLRFFCSLSMNGQNWLDVELLFDDVDAEIAALKAPPKVLSAEEVKETGAYWWKKIGADDFDEPVQVFEDEHYITHDPILIISRIGCVGAISQECWKGQFIGPIKMPGVQG